MNDQVTPTPEPLGTTTAGKRYHVAGTVHGTYEGNELKPYEGRPNAMDAFKLPSLMGGQRVWRGNVKEQA